MNKHIINKKFPGKRKFKRKQIIWFDNEVQIKINGRDIKLLPNEKIRLKSGDILEYNEDEVPANVYSKYKYTLRMFYEINIMPLLPSIFTITIFISSLFTLLSINSEIWYSILFGVITSLSMMLILISFINWLRARIRFSRFANYKVKMKVVNEENPNNEHSLFFSYKRIWLMKLFYTKQSSGKSRIFSYKYCGKTNSLQYKYIQKKMLIESEPDNIYLIGTAKLFLSEGKGIYITEETKPNFGTIEII